MPRVLLQGWQQERQASTALHKELDFFKASSAEAIAERDRAAFDAASARSDLEASTAALQDTTAQLAVAQQLSSDMQAQLASVQQQLKAEQQEAASCRLQLQQQKQQYEQQLQHQRNTHEQQLQSAAAVAESSKAQVSQLKAANANLHVSKQQGGAVLAQVQGAARHCGTALC